MASNLEQDPAGAGAMAGPAAEELGSDSQPAPLAGPEADADTPALAGAEHGAAIAGWALAAAEHRARTAGSALTELATTTDAAPAAEPASAGEQSATTEPPAPPKRQRDRVQTRAEILAVAAKEFADQGYDGARVDQIAAQMRTTKRMIYYYFGSKEELFVAVLEQAYATIRNAEQQIDVEQLDPVSAIRRLAELTFDHHESHQDFIRLVSIENIHRAEHLRRSPTIAGLNTRVIDLIAKIVERGRASGAFVRDVDAVDLHIMISAFCVFRVANRHTFGVIFNRDLTDPALRDHYREMLGDMVVGYLTGV